MAHLVMRRPDLAGLPPTPALPAGYALRAWRPHDELPALASALSAAFGEEWTSERVRTALTESPEVSAVYAVFAPGGAVAATASSRSLPERFPGAGVVHWVGTHPEHARRGLGAAVVSRVLGDVSERGHQAAALETQDHRLPAIRLYLRYGFTPVYEVEGEDHRWRWSRVLAALFRG